MNTGSYAMWYFGLLLPAVVALAVWYYRRTVPEIAPGARRLLLALRLLGLALLVLALAQPVFDWQRSLESAPSWSLAIDYSSSMDRTDGNKDGASRLDVALAGARRERAHVAVFFIDGSGCRAIVDLLRTGRESITPVVLRPEFKKDFRATASWFCHRNL